MDVASIDNSGKCFSLFNDDENFVVDREQEVMPALSSPDVSSCNSTESKVNIKNAEEIYDSNILKSSKTYSKRNSLGPLVCKAVNEQNAKNGYNWKSYSKGLNVTNTNQQTENADSTEKIVSEFQTFEKNDSNNQMMLEVVSSDVEINNEELKIVSEISMFGKTLPIKKRRMTSQSNAPMQVETKSEVPLIAVASVSNSPEIFKIKSSGHSSCNTGINDEELKTASELLVLGKPLLVKKRRMTRQATASVQVETKSEAPLIVVASEMRSPKMKIKSSSKDRCLKNDISSSNKRKKSQKNELDLVKKSQILPRSQLNVFKAKSDRKQKSVQNQLSACETKSLCNSNQLNSTKMCTSETKSLKNSEPCVTELQLSVDLPECQSPALNAGRKSETLKSVNDMGKLLSIVKSVPVQCVKKDLPSTEVIKEVNSLAEKNLKSSASVFESERRKSLRTCSKKLRYKNIDYEDIKKHRKTKQEMQNNEDISKNCKLNGIKYPKTMQKNKRSPKKKNESLVGNRQYGQRKQRNTLKKAKFNDSISPLLCVTTGNNSSENTNCTTAVTEITLSKSMRGNKIEHIGSKLNKMQFLNSVQRDISSVEKSQPFISLIDCNEKPKSAQIYKRSTKLPFIEKISSPMKMNDILKSSENCEEKELSDCKNVCLDEWSNFEIDNANVHPPLCHEKKLKDKNKDCAIDTLVAKKLNKSPKGKSALEATSENNINSVESVIFQSDAHSPRIGNRELAVRSNSEMLRKEVKFPNEHDEHQLEETSKNPIKSQVTPHSKKYFAEKLDLNSNCKVFNVSAKCQKSSLSVHNRSLSAVCEIPEKRCNLSPNSVSVKENEWDKLVDDSSTSTNKQLSLLDMVRRYSSSSNIEYLNSLSSPKILQNNHISNKRRKVRQQSSVVKSSYETRQSVRRKNKPNNSFNSSPCVEQNSIEQTSPSVKLLKKSNANGNRLQKIRKLNSVITAKRSLVTGEVLDAQKTLTKVKLSKISLTGTKKQRGINCNTPLKNTAGKSEITNVQRTLSTAAGIKNLPANSKFRVTSSKDSLVSIKVPKISKTCKNKIANVIDKKLVFDMLMPQVTQTAENNSVPLLNSIPVPQIGQTVENNSVPNVHAMLVPQIMQTAGNNSVPILNTMPVPQITQTAENNSVPILNSLPVPQITQPIENNVTANSVSRNLSAGNVVSMFGNWGASNSNFLVPASLPANVYSSLNVTLPYYPQIVPHINNPYFIIPSVSQFQNNAKNYLLPALPQRSVSDAEVQASILQPKCISCKNNCIQENITVLSEKYIETSQIQANSLHNSKFVRDVSSTRLSGVVGDEFQSSSLLFCDFLHFVKDVTNVIKDQSVATSKHLAEKFFLEKSFLYNITVRQFCTNSKVMKTLSSSLCQKCDEYNNVSPAIQYEFPDAFEDLELRNVLKDYLDFHLKAIENYFSLNSFPFTSESVLRYAYANLSFRECIYMTSLLRNACFELQIKELVSYLCLAGLMVIYNEFSERVEEQYVDSNINS